MWHEIWMLKGRPRVGYLANIRRKTRLKYHYAIRYIVKKETLLRNNKMAEAISDNNDRVLWDEVRKYSKSNNDLPNGMDGHSKVEEITDTFTDKYNTLYNSVSYTEHDLNKLTTDIESRIDISYPNINDISNKTPSISLQEVKNAILELKQGKK